MLGKIRLEPVQPDIGRSYLKAVSKLQVLALYVKEPDPHYWKPGFTEPDIGSNALQWWTRSPRIRTLGEIPFEAALLETKEPPLYRQIAPEAARLSRLGMSHSAIARALGVDHKTVKKALLASKKSPV